MTEPAAPATCELCGQPLEDAAHPGSESDHAPADLLRRLGDLAWLRPEFAGMLILAASRPDASWSQIAERLGVPATRLPEYRRELAAMDSDLAHALDVVRSDHAHARSDPDHARIQKLSEGDRVAFLDHRHRPAFGLVFAVVPAGVRPPPPCRSNKPRNHLSYVVTDALGRKLWPLAWTVRNHTQTGDRA